MPIPKKHNYYLYFTIHRQDFDFYCLQPNGLCVCLLLQFQMQSRPARRQLPPGIEDDVVFGILWVRVGLLKTIKPTTTAHKVLIQFWGEPTPAVLFTSQTNPVPQEYDVKCPITFFEKYLQDMRKNLKIEVENMGHVQLDLSKYLKKNLTLKDKSPFSQFKGFFEVLGKNSKKVGSLQLQLCANFNPEIALRQLEQEERVEECPASEMKQCQCRGNCICNPDKVTALDVIAVEKPQLFRQFYEEYREKASPVRAKPETIIDQRIPNSLNNIPNRGVFDPNKYSQPEEFSPKIGRNFPTVEKILTYSNLKLKKDEQVKESSKPVSIKEHLPRNSEPISQNLLKPSPPASKIELPRQEKERPAMLTEITRKPSQRQSKKREQEVQVQPVLQMDKADPHLSEVSEVQKMDESVSVQAQRQILSRVVNLNAELEKERSSPKKPKEYQQPKLEPPYQPLPNYLTSPPNLLPNLTLNRTQQRKGSSLLLNMVIQLNINSVTLPQASKFILSYRPYGQRDNIRNGPQLPSSFMMMFPVGQPQIAKMNKIPFILEFWNATDEELLGVIKLSLGKIQKGFILDGRLNELAIKTSLLPTVIHKGSHAIVSLIDKSVGQCYLSAHIGTSAQIQSYLNSPRQSASEPVPQPQPKKEEVVPAEKQTQLRKDGTFQDFTHLLQLIDSNTSDHFVQHLINFMKNKEATHEQFLTFLTNLDFKGGDIFRFLSQRDTMNCKDLSQCFEDYRQVKEKYALLAAATLKELTQDEITSVIKQIQEKSSFGIISKTDLSDIFKGRKLAKIAQLFGDIIESTKLIQWMKSKGKYSFRKFAVSQSTSQQIIQNMLIEECPNFMQQIQNVLISLTNNSSLPLSKIKTFFIRKGQQQFSLWFWYQLSSIVYRQFQENPQDKGQINTSLLYNWLALKAKQIAGKQNEQQPRQASQQEKSISDEPEKQPLVPEQNIPKPQPVKPINPPQNNSIIDSTNKENKSINNSHPKEKPQIQKQEQKLTEHTFVISLEELQLEQDLSGQCTVFYHFPYQQEQISSRKIQLLRDKHKYRLTCSGTHKFTIQQAIDKYLGQSTLSIRVVLGKQGQFYGDLHSEQLITKGNEFRVIPLFSVNREGMVGKIKLQIEYLQKTAQQHLLGRQTIKDVFLPKNGYLNFELSTTVDQNRLRQQFNLKEEFYIQISLDAFGENAALAPHFPPFHSKLYSDLSSDLSVSGSYKISLTPQILQHLRAGSCTARMSLVYYAKERGNYERKDMLVASFKAPLFAVIREEGLKGDYAFKNKLGMFVSLAHFSAKYQKAAKILTDVAGKSGESSRESFWLLIDFSQVINFQGDLGWLKFEIVTKGKRFTTEKTLIRQQGSFPLEGRCLCLQMGQEQFSITKILAVSVIIDSEKYGMDVNLRPIAKLLGRQKFTVNSQYFIVVDDQSRSRKMRVGAKIYALRGQANVGPFVEALAKNCIRNELVGDEKEDNYMEDIEALRKQLKMSGKAFDEALGQLLDKRKKQRLPKGFFISRIQPSLDLSPILAFDQSDIYLLAEEIASEVSQRDLLEYIQQSGLKLVNLRSEFLERYSFSKLNQLHLDQNVEYLGLSKEIDLLVFAHKIRVQELQQPQPAQPRGTQHKMVRVSIIRGYNFNLLYNGIMPNARVFMPEIGLQTEIVERSSQPVFNEHLNLQLHSQLKKLKVEVYHQMSEDTDAILIGQGVVSISEVTNSHEIPFSKVFRVVLSSLMSNRMQAALDVKIELTNSRQQLPQDKSYSEIDESIGDSRVEQAMQRIHKLTDFKKRVALFQSSDQD